MASLEPMSKDEIRDRVSRLLNALEGMANDAGRKNLDMHPSRHDQAVDRIVELMELYDARMVEIAAMRPIVEAVAKWGIGGGMPVEFYYQARAYVAQHPATEVSGEN